MFKPGDYVIFAKQKCSLRPGPRATEVAPAPHGDLYTYVVDKFWIVAETLPDHRVALLTRRNKRIEVRVDDPNLRRPRWWERLLYRRRFPHPSFHLEAPTETPASP